MSRSPALAVMTRRFPDKEHVFNSQERGTKIRVIPLTGTKRKGSSYSLVKVSRFGVITKRFPKGKHVFNLQERGTKIREIPLIEI